MSTAERAQRVRELFARLASEPAAARAARLAGEPDPRVRREVEELLRCAAVEDHALDRWSLDGDELRRALEEERGPWPDPPPESIGPYRVLGLLGAGSMSTVFLGQGPASVGTVAIKVLRPWLVAGAALRRFELEVEILSGLQHPRIARILDVGRADLGAGAHPYLVLEHIDGRPLDDWVSLAAPDRAARLRLFVAVCDAVAHAHARGVVHRDLKPGNVLVDAAGQPHVVDFGVARVADGEARATRLLTAAGQLVGTLEYMSPEQAAGRSADVDTRSDVYALGVILFELLSGRKPLELAGLPLPECLRRIAEQEAPPLRRIDRRIPGELETIVAAALEHDRARRYASVRELARDVERFLAHEPISARPASSFYLARKYARRHPAAASALVAGAAALCVTAVGVSLGWAEAREQAARAEESLADAEQALDESARVTAVLAGVIRAPEAAARGRDVLLRDVVLDLGSRIEEHLPDHPRGRGRLRFFLARSLDSLGELAPALDTVEAALSDMRTAGIDRGELYDDARLLRAHLHCQLGDWDAARAELGELHAEHVAAGRESDDQALLVLTQLGIVHQNLRDFEAAEAAFQRVLALRRAQGGDEDPDTLDARVSLAGLLLDRGRHAEALAELEDLLPRLRAAYAAEPHQLVIPTDHLAKALVLVGSFERALAERRTQVALCEKAFGPDHQRTWNARLDLLDSLNVLGRWDEGCALAREARAWAAATFGEAHVETLRAHQTAAVFLMSEGDLEGAVAALRDALAGARRVYPGECEPCVALRVNLAETLLYAGDREAAIAELEPLLTELRGRPPADPMSLSRVESALGRAYLVEGRRDEGLALVRAAVADQVAQAGPADPYTAILGLTLGEFLLAGGLHAETEEILRPLLAPQWEAAWEGGDDRRELAVGVVLQHGLALAGLGREDEASDALTRASELVGRMHAEFVSPQLRELLDALAQRLDP